MFMSSQRDSPLEFEFEFEFELELLIVLFSVGEKLTPGSVPGPQE